MTEQDWLKEWRGMVEDRNKWRGRAITAVAACVTLIVWLIIKYLP